MARMTSRVTLGATSVFPVDYIEHSKHQLETTLGCNMNQKHFLKPYMFGAYLLL